MHCGDGGYHNIKVYLVLSIFAEPRDFYAIQPNIFFIVVNVYRLILSNKSIRFVAITHMSETV